MSYKPRIAFVTAAMPGSRDVTHLECHMMTSPSSLWQPPRVTSSVADDVIMSSQQDVAVLKFVSCSITNCRNCQNAL